MMLQLLPTSSAIIQSHGEVQEKATKEYIENLSTRENGIHNDLPSIGPFINGEKPGLLDVIMGSYSKGIRVLADLDRWKGATGEGEVPILRSCLPEGKDAAPSKLAELQHVSGCIEPSFMLHGYQGFSFNNFNLVHDLGLDF
ncbi:uncharacterized protein [Elaeis guineensis]|uniref:uncharacterized protein n=1 Tax=Elaeis guineensis var. tenera TaxID=51953 RepID=UPI003C6CE151